MCHRQTVHIQIGHRIMILMGTICASLVADLFYIIMFTRGLVLSQPLAMIKLVLLKCLTLSPKYLDDLLNIDNLYFEQMVRQKRVQYNLSKTATQTLKHRQNKDLNDRWQLNTGRKYCRLVFAAFCNTFDLH